MEQTPKKKTAIIVGAGVGGVATAARLAKAGFAVTVFEKNEFTGGRCSLIQKDGYRFDQGPSLLLLPKLFKETFIDLDTTLEDEGVHLLKCDPNYKLHFPDNATFSLSTDTATMLSEITRYEGEAGFQRYLSFLREAHAHYHISYSQVLHRNFTSIFHFLRWDFFRYLLDLHPFESIYARAARYFWTERLRRVFTFGSMYMGMSPFDAPGTYSLLQYTELVEGIWYPVGGFWKVVDALVGIGERLGVKYRLGTSVASVIVSEQGERATGVRLESGEVVESDVVVVNADLVYAYNNLFSAPSSSPDTSSNSTTNGTAKIPIQQNSTSQIPPTPYATSLTKRPGSCSSLSFYWALSTRVPELTTHNIFLATHYRASFDSIFKDQNIPSDPSFYVNVPSRIDPTAAPEECDSVVVLVPVGHLLNSRTSLGSTRGDGSGQGKGVDEGFEERDWEGVVASARRQVIETIEARTGCAAIASLIKHEIVNSPPSWEERFNLDKGAILGLSHSFFNVLAFRPQIRHRGSASTSSTGSIFGFLFELLRNLLAIIGFSTGGLKNVYFVGASVHPGTGVPIVLAGAKMTAEVVLQDQGVERPWGDWEAGLGWKGEAAKGGKGVSALDRVQKGGGSGMYALGGLLAVLVALFWGVYLRGF